MKRSKYTLFCLAFAMPWVYFAVLELSIFVLMTCKFKSVITDTVFEIINYVSLSYNLSILMIEISGPKFINAGRRSVSVPLWMRILWYW